MLFIYFIFLLLVFTEVSKYLWYDSFAVVKISRFCWWKSKCFERYPKHFYSPRQINERKKKFFLRLVNWSSRSESFCCGFHTAASLSFASAHILRHFPLLDLQGLTLLCLLVIKSVLSVRLDLLLKTIYVCFPIDFVPRHFDLWSMSQITVMVAVGAFATTYSITNSITFLFHSTSSPRGDLCVYPKFYLYKNSHHVLFIIQLFWFQLVSQVQSHLVLFLCSCGRNDYFSR